MSETIPNQTTSKKMVSRNVVIALGIICIVLIVGFGGAMAYYIPKLEDKNNMISNLQDQNKQLESWLNENTTLLNQTQTWLKGNVTYYTSQITNLQNQVEQWQEPIPKLLSLTAEDVRNNTANPHLHISASIYNSGLTELKAGDIFIQAYESNGSQVIDSVEDYNINAQSSNTMDWNISYNGSALSSFAIEVGISLP